MIVVKLMGGLGNQMFQYALGKSLSRRLHTSFKLDLGFLLDRTPRENFVFRNYDLDVFCLQAQIATPTETNAFIPKKPNGPVGKTLEKIKSKIDPYKYFYEPHFHYAAEVFNLPKNTYLDGYWQSPKYFDRIEAEIRKDFEFKHPLPEAANSLAQHISQENSVCINVRRQDFLNNSFHGVCDMKYFNPAIKIMSSKVDSPHFFIFSDDPQWCIENFKLDAPVTFVGHEFKGPKFSDYLRLMALCKHYIIPNSSFAWWATWLNPDKNKIVIAPQIWFADEKWDPKDLIPATWTRVAN
jgi:hypothetical protein